MDKESWLKHVLPAMAPKLGIGVYAEDQYVNNPNNKSSISYDDWMKIVNYYEKTAPAKLPIAKPPIPLLQDWVIFELKKPSTTNQNIATTTLVSIDSLNKSVYTSNATTNYVNNWNQKLDQKLFAKLPSPAVYANYQKVANQAEEVTFTSIGKMDATDASIGMLLRYSSNISPKTPDTIAKICHALCKPLLLILIMMG